MVDQTLRRMIEAWPKLNERQRSAVWRGFVKSLTDRQLRALYRDMKKQFLSPNAQQARKRKKG